GYASAAVATACREALAGGAQQCMLYTDLANPTSNRIYPAVGFRRFADWEELELSRWAADGSPIDIALMSSSATPSGALRGSEESRASLRVAKHADEQAN